MIQAILGGLSSIGSLIGPAAKELMPLATDYAAQKIRGITTPKETIESARMSGADAGSYQRDYLMNAYPGTTPWEQLGASSNYGSVANQDTSSKTELEKQKRDQEYQLLLQQRQLDNELEKTDRSNIAHLLGTLGPENQSLALQALAMYRGTSNTLPNVPGRLDTKSREADLTQSLNESQMALYSAQREKVIAEYANATTDGQIKAIERDFKQTMMEAGIDEAKARAMFLRITSATNVVDSVGNLTKIKGIPTPSFKGKTSASSNPNSASADEYYKATNSLQE